ncbi:MAG: type II toxin-antitoxin system VapC family toxin [Gemmatimonadaceae bacterium]
MGVILDTSVLIAAERQSIRFDALLEKLGDEPIAISAVTASELLHGCYRASDAGIRTRRSAFVDALLDLLPVLPFGLPEARRHAALWSELVRAGGSVGPHDLIIGATAIARGYSLATLNRREFGRIPGLMLVDLVPFGS